LDIIHSADTWYPYTLQAVKTGKPTVVTEWENIPFNHEEAPFSQIKEYNHQHVNHFIAITEKARDLLIKEKADPRKITVIPAGLDCDHFKPAEKNLNLTEELKVSKEATKILFVGRFVQEKGIMDLIKAFAIVQKNRTNLQLILVGAGSSEMTMQVAGLITELNIQDKVKLLGFLNYQQMPQVHNIADIFCLPSADTKFWAEQFGYALVEAMACGKPAVSTFSGSIPEIVKDQSTGLLVEQHNPNALAAALDKLLSDNQLREKYGANARNWVLEKFEAEKVAKQIADVYKKVLP
jgi:glycosyltransferase involved in cell wall biosynthesis